jgi:hypothetical protein
MWTVMPNRARLIVVLLTGLLLASPAWAQFGGSTSAGSIATGKATRPAPAPTPAEPAALPGTRTNTGPAPLTKPPSEMGPTEALFDAVNRGDVGAARDATARGADLNGRNILGLTALELAVDLGQNEISFLLLSLRDAEPTARAGRPGARTAAAPPPPATRRPAPARIVSTTPATQQRQYHSDGGAPVPNAGFLGFGGR